MIRAYYHDGLIYTCDINATLEAGDSLNVSVPFDAGFDYALNIKSFTLTEDDIKTDADIEAERIALDAQLLEEYSRFKQWSEGSGFYDSDLYPIRIGAHAFFKEDVSAAWSRELKRRVQESEDKRKIHAQKDVLDEWEGTGV